MEKEFIPYEQALELKELGFDEPCFAKYYQQDGNTPFIQIGESEIEEAESAGDDVTFECDSPLYQQAFRWFREKHNLKGHIEAVEYLDETPDTYHWCVFDKFNSGYDQLTYEEAELECLKKLIEIVKKQKKDESKVTV